MEALHNAICSGNLEDVKYYIQRGQAVTDRHVETAVYEQQFDIVVFLVTNSRTTRRGNKIAFTVLRSALSYMWLEIIESFLLLDDHVTAHNILAAIWTWSPQVQDLVASLLDEGMATDYDALDIFIKNGAVDWINFILNRGCVTRDDAMEMAIRYNQYETINLFEEDDTFDDQFWEGWDIPYDHLVSS